MTKRLAKILIMGVALIMCIGLFAGCESNKNFVLGYNKIGAFGSKEVEGGTTFYTLEKASSVQELQALCIEFGNPAFQEDNEHYTNELSQKIRSYNEAFFNDKVLIVYSFDRGHSKETRIDSIKIEGPKLIINARLVTKKGTFTDEAFNWLMLIEVNRSDAIDATTVQVKYK